MKSGKNHQEKEEEDDEFGTKSDATPSTNNRDGRNSDKANAMRSKHSVTEQHRRSKINERFQILRDLIPHSDRKKDTASFLLEVIQYVQFLQEKVQKYEGSYPPCSSEPTKLMPWRNSHWHVQNFAGQPHTTKNGYGRFDETSVALVSTITQPVHPNLIASCRSIDSQNELPKKATGIPMPMQASMPVSIPNDGIFSHTLTGQSSDVQSTECPSTTDALNCQDEFEIEGGTISISSIYSQGLLNSLAQALQSTGVNLSQANIFVQINLGKRANTGPTPGVPIHKVCTILFIFAVL